MEHVYENLFSILYTEALKGSCMYRKYAAAIVKNNAVIGIGHARTVSGTPCVTCNRMDKIQEYGEISEFFEECPVIHAEMCAIMNCSQMQEIRGSDLFLLGVIAKDNSIYDNAFPCPNCFNVIQYCGIKSVNTFQSDMSVVSREVSA